MSKVIQIAFIVILCLVTSCSIEAEQINYGQDACSFCKMTIVDQQHAAQYVTKKGKQYKFDAIECMVNEIAEKGNGDIGIYLIANYQEPGNMTEAQMATYLISDAIKSPMGANLSGFASNEQAKITRTEKGGEIYSWNELLEKFDVK